VAVQTVNPAKADNDPAADGDAGTVLGAVGAGGAELDRGSATSIAISRAAAASLGSAAAVRLSAGGDSDKHSHGGNVPALSGTGNSAADLSQLGTNANAVVTASTDTTPMPTLRVQAAVDSAGFPQSLSDRVSWMVDNNLNGAKLQVNPPQLGPIEVRISVQGDHAQVWMTSHSAVTRDALESSSPKLREMLGAQGFGQVSVDISQRSFQDRSAYSQPYQRTPAPDQAGSAKPVSTVSAVTPRASLGALDAYA
jgi:flagellar hook-length control protein FliK